MEFLSTDKEFEYHLMDKGELVGKGYIFENEASKFYDRQRMNYFIEFDSVKDMKKEYAKEIIYNLVEIAKHKRKKYKDFDARVYHCSFSEKTDMINLYKTIEGFNADEGMHILSLDLGNVEISDIEINPDYLVEVNELASESQVNELIEQHAKSFRVGSYIAKDFEDLLQKKAFRCVSIRKDKQIVANVIVFIKEDGIGFFEDLFVNHNHRGNGLAKYLVNHVSSYMKMNGVKQMDLEVWSNNYKAYELYKKMGYTFKCQSEVSIGKSI